MDIHELFSLKDKVAIITGGGKGLGFIFAEALAEAGSSVVLCSRKDANCKKAAARLEQKGFHAVGIKCDVSDPNSIMKLKSNVLEKLGRIDILINNAGATWGASAENYPLEGWNKVIRVNVTGTFLCSQIIGNEMIEKGGGKIINIASVVGGVGCKPELMEAIAYNTSKGAVEAFTKDLAAKWAGYHINVNAIAPGFFETDMTKATMDKSGTHILNHIPLGRFGSPLDLKGIVVFLCSKASDYITGTVMFVDGGYRAV
jgi:gluconate 5-dehydrogenase